MYDGVLLFPSALLREPLNKYWQFKYNKIISVMAYREFFQENNDEKFIMSDKFIYLWLFGKINV
ncbi:hypothetical protein QF91_001058 [Salmonella enterica subsp. salamae]|nr:hypothetical protein [Salmonella enterica subsp. salamae]ECI4076373.1 hypothetical protein [Salmonella enterica subsp. salamae]EDH0693963.1 hypothetical protein [Salmonella enterica]EDV0901948.1 hypothetical protein [Salmonella enterica subsp. salamae]